MKKVYVSVGLLLILAGIVYAQNAAPVDLATRIREGTDSFLSVSFRDQNGVAVVPGSVIYKVTDESTGVVLIPNATPVATLASTLTIDINRCAARIINGSKKDENRLVPVIFTYGGGAYTGTDYARYKVDNIPDIAVTPVTTPGTPCVVGTVPTPTP
jgi:hypothetical protein